MRGAAARPHAAAVCKRERSFPYERLRAVAPPVPTTRKRNLVSVSTRSTVASANGRRTALAMQ